MAEFRIPESVIWEELEGEVVLLNLSTGTYFALNATGARAFQLLGELGNLRSVLERMAAEYAVPDDRLRADVQALVDDLLARELLERGEA